MPAMEYPGIAAFCPVPFSTTARSMLFTRRDVERETACRTMAGLLMKISVPSNSVTLSTRRGS